MINFVAVSPNRDRLIIQWDYDQFTTVSTKSEGEYPHDGPVPDNYAVLLDTPED